MSANHFARPWSAPGLGGGGGSPEQRWDSRHPITVAERQCFEKTLAITPTQVMIELNLRPADLNRRAVRATVARTAIRETLKSLAYLFVLGGPIRPPLKSTECHVIT